jgi:hypothetical protein
MNTLTRRLVEAVAKELTKEVPISHALSDGPAYGQRKVWGEWPVKVSIGELRRRLATDHDLPEQGFGVARWKTVITVVLDKMPEWIRYKNSLYWKPRLEFLAKLDDEDLERRRPSHNYDGQDHYYWNARQIARDALGISQPGHTLEEERILQRAAAIKAKRRGESWALTE